ncbi:MAG: glycerol-3-phosphate dehydrogenase [Candidatus Binatia bacterium]
MATGVSIDRRAKLRRLAEDDFDLLVIGGGINGAGTAREAALRGLRVAMVEKGDFASGTSSRSSKLIHGGIRYLETGDVALVLESSRERDLLRRRLAPHLVRPLPFVFPVYRSGPVGMWKLRAGMVAYDLLATFRNIDRHRMFSAARLFEVEPALRREELRGGALYYDCWTDDSRLVLETVLAGEMAGATCLNYVALDSFAKRDGRLCGATIRDLEGEGETTIRARTIVNATGPWLDRIRTLDDSGAAPCLRPTKGVHIVVPRERLGNRNAIVLNAVRDGRVLFAIPWEDSAIVGTTDTDYTGSPDDVEADAGDVAYLLETANHYFPAARLVESDVTSTFAGLRPLVSSEPGETPSEVSREEAIFESASGLLSIGGGKLTTYRRVAIKVVDRIAARLRRDFDIVARDRSGTDREPLPGGHLTDLERFARELETQNPTPDVSVARIARQYGSRAKDFLERVRDLAWWREPLAPGTPHVRGEAWFSAATEHARRLEDVLRRRTSVALRTSDRGASSAEPASRAMADALGWDDRVRTERLREYLDGAGERWRGEPRERKKA